MFLGVWLCFFCGVRTTPLRRERVAVPHSTDVGRLQTPRPFRVFPPPARTELVVSRLLPQFIGEHGLGLASQVLLPVSSSGIFRRHFLLVTAWLHNPCSRFYFDILAAQLDFFFHVPDSTTCLCAARIYLTAFLPCVGPFQGLLGISELIASLLVLTPIIPASIALFHGASFLSRPWSL